MTERFRCLQSCINPVRFEMLRDANSLRLNFDIAILNGEYCQRLCIVAILVGKWEKEQRRYGSGQQRTISRSEEAFSLQPLW